jgi:hypothetical protein
MTHVSLEEARSLFAEARDYFSERKHYVPERSPLRDVAARIYGRSSLSTLDRVCTDIFYVVACFAEKAEP